MISIPVVKMALKAAIRDKLLIAAFLIILCSSLLSVFFGSAAVIEQDLFAAVYMAAGLRLVSAISIILSVCFYIRRLFDDRQIEYLLSRPISKVSLIISHAFAYVILSLPITILVAMPILMISSKLPETALPIWLLTIYIELVIAANIAVFCSMVIKSSFGACAATLSFYVFGRLVGEILGIVHASASNSLTQGLSKVFEFVSIIVPRLDLMGQSSWLIYGDVSITQVTYIIMHGVLFVVLLILATCIDLLRKQF